MSGRQLRAVFGVLVALILVTVVMRLGGGSDAGPSGAPDIGRAVGPGVSVIRVIGPGSADSTHLSGSGAGWTVNGYPADTASVRQAIEGLDSARIGRLVARSPANHPRLGVVADSARRIEIGPVDDPAIVFLLGFAGIDGHFVRFPGSDEVYAVASASVRALEQSVDDWRDRLIAAVDTSAVVRIRVRRGAEQTDLGRAQADSAPGWLADGVRTDSAAIAAILGAVVDLRANGFPSDSVALAADFGGTPAVLEFYDSEAIGSPPSVALLFLPVEDRRDFLVRRARDPLVYVVTAAQAERLLPAREVLIPEE